jgi:hypothetical protein
MAAKLAAKIATGFGADFTHALIFGIIPEFVNPDSATITDAAITAQAITASKFQPKFAARIPARHPHAAQKPASPMKISYAIPQA